MQPRYHATPLPCCNVTKQKAFSIITESFLETWRTDYSSCNSSSMARMAASLHGTSSYAHPLLMANSILPSFLFYCLFLRCWWYNLHGSSAVYTGVSKTFLRCLEPTGVVRLGTGAGSFWLWSFLFFGSVALSVADRACALKTNTSIAKSLRFVNIYCLMYLIYCTYVV